MKAIHHLKEGWAHLKTARLRSLLALLGILVGTASVVAMVLGGKIATNETLKQFNQLGTDLLAMAIVETPGNASGANHSTAHLTLNNALAVQFSSPEILNAAPYTQLFSRVQFNAVDLNSSVLGVTDSFADILHIKMQEGRFISILDRYALFCVVGQAIAKKIQALTFHGPIGQQVQIGNDIFTIIGIADAWPENNFVYANIDHSILVPLLTTTVLSQYSIINNKNYRLHIIRQFA